MKFTSIAATIVGAAVAGGTVKEMDKEDKSYLLREFRFAHDYYIEGNHMHTSASAAKKRYDDCMYKYDHLVCPKSWWSGETYCPLLLLGLKNCYNQTFKVFMGDKGEYLYKAGEALVKDEFAENCA